MAENDRAPYWRILRIALSSEDGVEVPGQGVVLLRVVAVVF
jgi:hypothetical protein